MSLILFAFLSFVRPGLISCRNYQDSTQQPRLLSTANFGESWERRKWAPTSASRWRRGDIAKISRMLQPIELAGDWEKLCRAGMPSHEETKAMLRDVQRVIGSRRGLWELFGVCAGTVDLWGAKAGGSSASSRRLVWLTWLMVCRPEVWPLTFFELACYGRTRVRADPASAGVATGPMPRVGRPHTRKPSKRRGAPSGASGPCPLTLALSSLALSLGHCEAAAAIKQGRRVKRSA